MQFPRIHLNGSHGPTLLEQYTDAMAAMRDAIAAMRRIEVSGRDYYVISADAGSMAYSQHQTRVATLEQVNHELEAIAENISDQIG